MATANYSISIANIFEANARNHFPHGPNRFARHFARRRGIPHTSRCKKHALALPSGRCTKSVAGPRVADTQNLASAMRRHNKYNPPSGRHKDEYRKLLREI